MSDKKGGEKTTQHSPPPKTEKNPYPAHDSQTSTFRRDEGKSYLPNTPLPGKPVPKPLPDKPVKK